LTDVLKKLGSNEGNNQERKLNRLTELLTNEAGKPAASKMFGELLRMREMSLARYSGRPIGDHGDYVMTRLEIQEAFKESESIYIPQYVSYSSIPIQLQLTRIQTSQKERSELAGALCDWINSTGRIHNVGDALRTWLRARDPVMNGTHNRRR